MYYLPALGQSRSWNTLYGEDGVDNADQGRRLRSAFSRSWHNFHNLGVLSGKEHIHMHVYMYDGQVTRQLISLREWDVIGLWSTVCFPFSGYTKLQSSTKKWQLHSSQDTAQQGLKFFSITIFLISKMHCCCA